MLVEKVTVVMLVLTADYSELLRVMLVSAGCSDVSSNNYSGISSNSWLVM